MELLVSQNTQYHVSDVEQLGSNPNKMKQLLLWDDIKVFLACHEQKSFRKAGNLLGISASTVTRRIDNFENALSKCLFFRLREGIALSPDGELIIESCQIIHNTILSLLGKVLRHLSNGNTPLSDKKYNLEKSIKISDRISSLDWGDLKIFLAYSREKSVRKAGQVLQYSPAKIQRRMENLEEFLNVELLDKNNNVSSTTSIGAEILEDIRNVERSVYDIMRQISTMEHDLRGEVIISITEGLGSYWLVPKISDFKKTYPGISMELDCRMETANVMNLDAHVSVQLKKPTDPDLIVQKIGRLHVYPFATESYFSNYGKPDSTEQLESHSFVIQVAPDLDYEAVWRYFKKDLSNNVNVKTNASTAHFNAIVTGVGIGVLPTYATSMGMPVVPIDIVDSSYSLDIWLTYHPDVKRVKKNEIVINWLKDVFDSRTHPCFKDRFIHPNDLKAMKSGSAEVKAVASMYLQPEEN